ncbi:hypothetical protein EGT07_12040 [Herbaspirillum sp. HC18]|nr:hypothetical protein EGT07_12040 [Herbaspirillum sp. HC18]
MLVPPELPDPLVAAPDPVVAPELADPGPVAPIEPPLDDVPLLPYPDESVPPLAPDSVVPELPLVPGVLEDGPDCMPLPAVPVEEPAAAGLSELIEPLVPRSDVAGAV